MDPDAVERKLAAIMFTDIVGYTALMAESEQRGRRVRELSPDSTGWPQLPSEEYGAAPRSGIPKGLLSDWLAEGVRR